METGIILSQITILAIIVVTGAVGAHFKVITAGSKDMLSKVIFNISLPFMLFTNFLKLEATPQLLSNSITVIALSVIVLLFMLLFGWGTTKIFHMSRSEAPVFRAHSMFGNIIFLGFPLINTLFGKEGLLYASMFQLVSNILMWSLGVIILSHNNGTPWKKSLRRVVNPNTVATIAGLLFFIFSVKVPQIIVTPLSGMGSANTWLSMLYIGAMLYFSDVKGIIGKRIIYILSINRLVLVPAILIPAFALFAGITGIEPDDLVISVIIMEASMPCMASVVIMAKEFGADDHLAVANVFVSTLLSIITLPLVLMMLNRFLQH